MYTKLVNQCIQNNVNKTMYTRQCIQNNSFIQNIYTKQCIQNKSTLSNVYEQCILIQCIQHNVYKAMHEIHIYKPMLYKTMYT